MRFKLAPRALTSLKYFYEKEPEYHIICASSLFGVYVNRNTYSFPVGKVQMINMYPMDFEEYLWALGKEDIAQLIKEHYKLSKPIAIHENILEIYKAYLSIGGMPRAVSEFLRTNDYTFAKIVLKDLNDAYIADMAKYASSSDTEKLRETWSKIPAILSRDSKKFKYSLVKPRGTKREFETTISWLISAGLIHQCKKTKEGLLPLSAYADDAHFKVYMLDTGILCSKFEINPSLIFDSPVEFSIFKGALAENYVMQALVTNGHTPYYWSSGNVAEIDFVIQNEKGEIIPIECKSGYNTKSKSLLEFTKKYKVGSRIRISMKNFSKDEKTIYIPLYAVFCI